MRNVLLDMSISLDGYVASDREHPGVAIAEDAERRQWKLEHIVFSKTLVDARAFSSGVELHVYRPQRGPVGSEA